ncbi:MAG: rhodanese-like domain-containing protein [Lacibacter sp.]
MKQTLFLTVLTVLLVCGFGCTSTSNQKNYAENSREKYQCIPCGYDCDQELYNEPGICSHCKMELVKSTTINFKTMQPDEICGYIKAHPKTILLDVRTKEEFEGKANPDFGSLKNAINLPIQEFNTKLSGLDSLKNREIIVYCSHSHRSPRAAYILTQKGFKNIINMAGGMSALKDNSCKK